MKSSSLQDSIKSKVQTQQNMYKTDYMVSDLKMRITHIESILEGIRELQSQALSVRRTPLTTNPIVRQQIPLNFTDSTFRTIIILVLNITLYV
jgi:hypothetical protein